MLPHWNSEQSGGQPGQMVEQNFPEGYDGQGSKFLRVQVRLAYGAQTVIGFHSNSIDCVQVRNVIVPVSAIRRAMGAIVAQKCGMRQRLCEGGCISIWGEWGDEGRQTTEDGRRG